MSRESPEDAIDVSLLPSAADVESYQRHGWWISPPVIPAALLEDARHGAERHYAGERDFPLPIAGGHLDWTPEQGATIRLNDYVSLQNEEIRRLVHLPVIGAIAARLAGTPAVRLFHDQLVCKPAGLGAAESSIGWHVDAAYWQTCTSRSMLTAWIPFQDCDAEIGPLAVVDGSHRWPGNEWMRTFNDHDLEKLERSFSTGGESVRKVPLLLGKGQMSFHHCLTLHGSMPNRSRRDRLALAVHLQDAANRSRRHVEANGRAALHINDLLCRRGADGLPDYADSEICPLLWQDAPAGAPA
jgi:hypothetical protein